MNLYTAHITNCLKAVYNSNWVRSNVSLSRRLWLPLSVHIWSHSPTQPMHKCTMKLQTDHHTGNYIPSGFASRHLCSYWCPNFRCPQIYVSRSIEYHIIPTNEISSCMKIKTCKYNSEIHFICSGIVMKRKFPSIPQLAFDWFGSFSAKTKELYI